MLAISRHKKSLQAPPTKPLSDSDSSSSSDESRPGDSGQDSPILEPVGGGTQANDCLNIYYLKPKPYNGEGRCQTGSTCVPASFPWGFPQILTKMPPAKLCTILIRYDQIVDMAVEYIT